MCINSANCVVPKVSFRSSSLNPFIGLTRWSYSWSSVEWLDLRAYDRFGCMLWNHYFIDFVHNYSGLSRPSIEFNAINVMNLKHWRSSNSKLPLRRSKMPLKSIRHRHNRGKLCLTYLRERRPWTRHLLRQTDDRIRTYSTSWDHLLGLYFATNDVKGKNFLGALSFAYLGLESIDDNRVPIDDLYLESLRWFQLVKSLHSDMTVERSNHYDEVISLYNRPWQFHQYLMWKVYLISGNRSRQSDGKLHVVITEAYGFNRIMGESLRLFRKHLNKW